MASLSDFSKKRVAVFGDVMVDTNVYGTIERLNPEDYTAPIILVKQKTSLPGGAANVAANITSLSGQASLYGVIGKDESGSILERMCGERNIAGYLRYDPSRRTTLKTRIFEQEGHQCMRIDEEDRHSISASLERYFTFHSLTDASAMIDAIFPLELRISQPELVYSSQDFMTRCGIGICGSCADKIGRRACLEGPFLTSYN